MEDSKYNSDIINILKILKMLITLAILRGMDWKRAKKGDKETIRRLQQSEQKMVVDWFRMEEMQNKYIDFGDRNDRTCYDRLD